MSAARFDPEQFFERADNVALSVSADEVFGILTRSFDLPGAWGAMVLLASGAQDVTRAGGVIDGAEAEDVLFVRGTPIDIALSEKDLTTSDSFSCRADLALQINLVLERGELVSFAQSVLGSRRVVQTDGLVRYLQPSIRAAMARFVGEVGSDALFDPTAADRAVDALSSALQAPCFSAGLSLTARPVVTFHSESIGRVREARSDAARQEAEHEASDGLRRAVEQAQSMHVEHVAGVLERLSELTAATPDVPLRELIHTFPSTQRGELYAALFAVESPEQQTRFIVIAAGDDLLFYEPHCLEKPCRRVCVMGEAGRVRSVQAGTDSSGADVLWLGAECGVYRMSTSSEKPDRTFVVPNAPSVRGGFNAVACCGNHVIASHSELGLWQWDTESDAPGVVCQETMTRAARTIRNVQVQSGSLSCAIDDRVVRWSPDGSSDSTGTYIGSDSAITALLCVGDDVYAGNTDGDVLRWPAGRFDQPERIHRGAQRAVESVFALKTHGVLRLFFADTSPRVHARVVGDDFTRSYEAGGQTLRRVEVASDILVATNELRDRVFVWSTGKPGPAQSVIPVGSLTGRSIQDVCLVSST